MADPLDRERLFDAERIRERLRRLRMDSSLDVKEFAAKCGLSHWSVYKKEGGQVDWQTSDFIAIGKAYPEMPALFPLLDWSEAERLEDAEAENRRLRRELADRRKP